MTAKKIIPIIILLNLSVIFILDAKGQLPTKEQQEALLPQAMEVTLKWSYTISEEFYISITSSPAIADLNRDGALEVIIGSSEREIFCLSATGKKIWKYKFETGGPIFSSPAIADLNGDGKLELIGGGFDGGIYCISNTGTKKWEYETGNSIFTSPAVADLDDDGNLDIIVGSCDRKIYCLTNNGTKKWEYQTGEDIYSSPAIADLDGDGKLEVVIGSANYKVYCLTNDGMKKWEFGTGGNVKSSPAVGDLDGDGKLEVIFSSCDDKFYCLNADGTKRWEYQTSYIQESSPAIADLNSDGKLEVIIGACDNKVYCFNDLGTKLWEYQTDHWVFSSPAIADLDGDGNLEVIISSYDNKVHFLSHMGVLKWEYLTGDAIYHSPTVTDLDGDEILEIIVCSEDGKVYCLELSNVSSSGDHPWHCFRGSVFQTGCIDSDSDYLDDLTEKFYQTDPTNPDSDSDGLLDGLEIQLGLNPLQDDGNEDLDGDGLSNYEELKIYHTLFFNPDSDGDRLKDGWEIQHGYNPLKWDNWPHLFGLYLLPIYLAIIVLISTPLVKLVKTRQSRRKEEKLVVKGRQLLEKGKLEEALNCFEKALRVIPSHPEALRGQMRAKELLAEVERIKLQKYREESFRKIINNYREISLEVMAQLLKFGNTLELQRWLIDLPGERLFHIKGNKAIIPRELRIGTAEAEEAINRIVESFGQIKHYTCYYCGFPIERDSKRCSDCRKKVLHCSVCKLPISFGEEIGKCSLCEARGHYTHLYEWVKMNGKCPSCLQEVPVESIVPITPEKKKEKKI